MQDVEKKQEGTDVQYDLKAQVTINKGYTLPAAKLCVSGTINQDEEKELDKIVQRSVLFLIDRSGSMSGSRINMVREVLKPFVEEICEDENTMIKVVLFDSYTEQIEIPNNRQRAGNLIEQRVRAQGGTNFHKASQGLVNAAIQMLEAHPTFQLTVIMCSDGEVGKDNARRGHSHWKNFVNNKYLKVHTIPPYVETIGISSSHDADVLSGFIVNDSCGNYVRVTDSTGIREAFQNAQNETMARASTKLTIEVPLCVHKRIQLIRWKDSGPMKHEIIAVGDEFSSNFWVGVDELQQSIQIAGQLFVAVNGQQVPLEIEEVTDDSQCQVEAIEFYDCILKDMLQSLRTITDPQALKAKAQEIDHALNNELLVALTEITAGPVEKRKLQRQIQELLVMDEDQKEQEMRSISIRRAELMKEYRSKSQAWKRHRSFMMPFQQTLSGLKSLVREIMLGQVRMQEIRQHILDLHFRKTHQKRVGKLVLSEEQLKERQQKYDSIQPPKESECMDITDEMGSGCFLSTMSMRECVLDAEPMWLCGRVDRSGGAQVSNPELIKIDYISSDLVSDSYFRMAIEAAAGGEVDAQGGGSKENQNANVTFCDSARQRVNCRLFPIYGNVAHFNCSRAYFDEAVGHTLSGRVDIRAADFNLPSAVIGTMISQSVLSTHNMQRLLFTLVPSMKIFLNNHTTRPFDLTAYNRQGLRSGPKEPLANRRRCRLVEYLKSFRARTTAWVSTANALFADRLMNMDVKVDHEFYLSILLQRLRLMFSCQIPKENDKNLQERVRQNHKHLLRVLVCGAEGRVNINDADVDSKEQEHSDGSGLVFDTTKGTIEYYQLLEEPITEPIDIGNIDEDTAVAQFDVNELKPSTKQMLQNVMSRVDIRDLLQSHAFFDILTQMGPNPDEETCNFEAFSNHKYADFAKIPNDLNLLLAELGFKGDIVQVLRAICAVAILTHSNKQWNDNLHWFGDDKLKQIFNDPVSVLKYIYRTFLLKQLRREYQVVLQKRERAKCIEIHTNPLLPDDIDENGNLPVLRCAWKRCGKVFQTREQLLRHVKVSRPKRLSSRFHVNCREVLSVDPDIEFPEFYRRVMSKFDNGQGRCYSNESYFRAYYNQMQPLLRQKK